MKTKWKQKKKQALLKKKVHTGHDWKKIFKENNRPKRFLEKKINYERKWQKIQMIEMISQDESTNTSIPGGLKEFLKNERTEKLFSI